MSVLVQTNAVKIDSGEPTYNLSDNNSTTVSLTPNTSIFSPDKTTSVAGIKINWFYVILAVLFWYFFVRK